MTPTVPESDYLHQLSEVERLTALGDAMCAGARNTDYAMLHEACSAWEQRDMKGGGAMTTEVGASK